MSITARLRDSVQLPNGGSLVNGFALDRRADRPHRALLRNGPTLEVHDLSGLFTGDRAPTAVFPLPWPGWRGGVHSVSADASFAVFSGQRAVRAVALGGATLWEYRHDCWSPLLGHPHTGDEQEVCDGLEHGSCRISDDGRLVWAHVVAPEEHRGREYWAVLDARDGHELARLPLDGAASGSHHVSHPDGVHMGLSIGMGQDGLLLHWARWDGEELTAWDLNETLDRDLTDVHPAHPGFLTAEHDGADLRLHALDGTVLAEGEAAGAGPESPEEADLDDEDEPLCWDHGGGFVDADTVIASTIDAADDPAEGRHWLLDAHTLEIRGAITYPTGHVDSYVRPLGDGTWLTYDDVSGTLARWSEAAS
ncbi:hypothetical protein CTU88_12455 [Streptomyces sp. JV178]|uniref:hypothetical protein n=1 Tax=Streptomyces sp. JV178 TaxID=858632 RepID=UPI000C1B10E3|nr:hypothetical protein [Streptomyces sp. JV178]PIM72341.1 hypothetical protein CTU88_12455 [Streptomyces sp. JV178]